jgi:hypothetical protein
VNPNNKGRASLVSVITTPLGFFALSLLIVEGFLGITLIGPAAELQRFWGMMIGAALFLIVVTLVTLLVWRKPQNLTFSGGEHIQHDKMALGDQDTSLSTRDTSTSPADVGNGENE